MSFFRCGFFFFQAEDGIRDADVTGVQTCALPISHAWPPPTKVAVSDRFGLPRVQTGGNGAPEASRATVTRNQSALRAGPSPGSRFGDGVDPFQLGK